MSSRGVTSKREADVVLTPAMSLISAWLWLDVLRHGVNRSVSGQRNSWVLAAIAIAWAVVTWVRRLRGSK